MTTEVDPKPTLSNYNHLMDKFDFPDRSYDDLYDAITSWAMGQSQIEAMFIAGSLAKGDADEFSDLDLVIVAEDEGFYPTLQEEVFTVIDRIEKVVHQIRLQPLVGIRILSLITDQWHRVDIAFGSSTSGILSQRLIPILDPQELWKKPSSDPAPNPAGGEEVTALVNEFLRVLGLSVVVNGRGDVYAAHEGANLLRNMLVELMLMEPPRRLRPSAKKLLPVLNSEQRATLAGLPPVADDAKTIKSFTTAVATEFLQRARALAAQSGGAWPTEFESATMLYLRGTIDI